MPVREADTSTRAGGEIALAAAPFLRRDWLHAAILGVTASLVAWSVHGHFAKPHGDFPELWETGDALLSGDLPPRFKRAPLYPLLVATLGRIAGLAGVTDAPAYAAAEWLNAALLPLNVLLLWVLIRRLARGAAAWIALWFTFVPVGLYCTAHTLLEPLLVTLLLLTLILAGRASRWAYVCAALASVTRYDAAGAIIGLMLAEVWRRRPPASTLRRGVLASLPLAAWLLTTLLSSNSAGHDHYVSEIAERPQFDLLWAVAVTHRVALDLTEMRLVFPLDGLMPALRVLFQVGVLTGIAVGLYFGLREHPRVMIPALAIYVVYTLIHAVFPFQFDRFGYPLVPSYLVAVAVGGLWLTAQEQWHQGGCCATALEKCQQGQAPSATAPILNEAPSLPLGAQRSSQPTAAWAPRVDKWPLVSLTAVTLGIMFAFAAAAAFDALGSMRAAPYRWAIPLRWVVPVSALLLSATPWIVRSACSTGRAGRRLSTAILLFFVFTALGLTHLRSAVANLGDGRSLENLVTAAQWVRDHLRPEDRVLSAMPGMLRLYAGRRAAGRFVDFREIEAQTWPEIVAECHQRGIRYVLWHDQLFAELGDYYSARLRLERFELLSQPADVPGIEIVECWPGRPNTWILRIK